MRGEGNGSRGRKEYYLIERYFALHIWWHISWFHRFFNGLITAVEQPFHFVHL